MRLRFAWAAFLAVWMHMQFEGTVRNTREIVRCAELRKQ
jgi:hypothetical protein